jgi:selenide,water dikinase
VARLDALLARCRAWQRPLALAVVGGGAGGVELALALQHRLECERLAAGQPESLRARVRWAPAASPGLR